MRNLTWIISFMILLGSSAFLFGQEEESEDKKPKYGWQKEMVGTLNFTQNQFDNWRAGGEDSWSWQLDINGKFVKNQEKYNWSNSGKISYGKTKLGDAASRKSADEIKLESVYTRKLGYHIDPYVSVSGQTQFTKGYAYTDTSKNAISNFMDPGYFTQSIGIGFSPNDNFKTRLGAAAKETFTKEYENTYGKGEELRVEYGAESVTDVKLQLSDLIVYTSKLEMFSNLQRFDEIDVNWDNLFAAKVSKYIVVSLNVTLFYDKDVHWKRQLKQVLAVGLSYSFL